MLRKGSGEPLVLLHGIISGERTWSNVMPLLAPHHDVIVLTALGHNGGPPVNTRPASFEHVTDDVERQLNELGVGKVHLAGNSMGGWIAIELARRGRARTVCALSPAGAWDHDWTDKQRVFKILSDALRDARRLRRLAPLGAGSKLVRRTALRHMAVHGERVSSAEFLDILDDTAGCVIAEDLLADGAQLEPLDPTPCPITLAWSARDQLFLVDVYGARARHLIPGARFVVLEDMGHVPMFDDPQLVAQTILATTRQSSSDDLVGGTVTRLP
ncbi:MAG TPA: alpha/beta hydrolase [Solirubrobacteraceae bacterium]